MKYRRIMPKFLLLGMQKIEKIGIAIAILVVLIIIFAISIGNKQKTTNPKVNINCDTACHKIGIMGWTFSGAGPISKNLFPTQGDCISACQARSKK